MATDPPENDALRSQRLDPNRLGVRGVESHDRIVDKFVARENVKHLRRELENGQTQPTRATMLRIMVEEENHLGHNQEQLGRLDHHISRLSQIIAGHVELTDKLRANSQPTERAELLLATYNDMMACYIAHRERIKASLYGIISQ